MKRKRVIERSNFTKTLNKKQEDVMIQFYGLLYNQHIESVDIFVTDSGDYSEIRYDLKSDSNRQKSIGIQTEYGHRFDSDYFLLLFFRCRIGLPRHIVRQILSFDTVFSYAIYEQPINTIRIY